MQIYRVDHISQVVPDLEAQVALLEGLFGLQRLRHWDNPAEGSRGVRLSVPGASGQVWEVLAPTGDGSDLAAFLEAKGGRPGFHHAAVEVPDLEAAVREIEGLGLDVTRHASGWVEASLTPPDHGAGPLFRLRGPGSLALCGDDESAPAESPARNGGAPSLGVVAIDHVCQAFPDRDELAKWYENLAGFMQVWRTPIDEHPDMADLVLNIPGSAICWEIIMPRGDDSFIQRFLDRSGAAVHHITLEVADWDQAMAACEHHETPTFDENQGETDGARWRDAFIHPKNTGGILIQLFWEERPGVWVRSDKIPPQ